MIKRTLDDYRFPAETFKAPEAVKTPSILTCKPVEKAVQAPLPPGHFCVVSRAL
ncbi:MAG: hypothetical protein L5656_04320 [Thermanaeromonas sp.]|nr:hypothetical protein [Thermanaeromonas sp.]